MRAMGVIWTHIERIVGRVRWLWHEDDVRALSGAMLESLGREFVELGRL